MDLTTIANISGITTGTIGTLLATYTAFKKSQMEAFFADLIKLEYKISPILEDQDSKAYFYKILENATHEANKEKLKYWKNAILSLATTHFKFDYKDDFIKILASLTTSDLTILYYIYITEFNTKEIRTPVLEWFSKSGMNSTYVEKNLKNLSAYNLITEVQELSAVLGLAYAPMDFQKNELGSEFIKFCANEMED